MRAKIQAFIISVFIINNCLAQTQFKCQVLNAKTNQALEGATIINTTKSTITKTNALGFFTMPVNNNDTLEIKHIGHKTYYQVILPNTNLPSIILLEPITYLLQPAVISNNNLYKNPKKAASLIKTDSLLNNFTKYTAWPQESEISLSNYGVSLNGLINKIWINTSKRGKEIVKVGQLIEVKENQTKADNIWQKIVTKTKINFPEIADSTIDKCRPNTSDILYNSEYFLLLNLNTCINKKN